MAGKGHWGRFAVSNEMDKGDLSKDVTFELRPEGSEEVSPVALWGRALFQAEGPACAKALGQDEAW